MIKSKVIVLHDSILPSYRGFCPLVAALIDGEQRVGVTALWGAEDYDTGDIIGSKEVEINYPVKISEVIDMVLPLYRELVFFCIDTITQEKQFVSTAQCNYYSVYSPWRDDEDYRINWNWDAAKIARFVDAVSYPYKGAYTYYFEKCKVIDCEAVTDVNISDRQTHVGKVLFTQDDCPVVICGKGLLKITGMTTENDKSLLPLRKFRIRFV